MKKIIILYIIIQMYSLNATISTVYYKNQHFPIHTTKKFVLLQNISDSNQFKALYPSIQLLSFFHDDLHNIVKNIKSTPNSNLKSTIAIINTNISLDSLAKYTHFQYIAPYFYVDSTTSWGYSHFFLIKLAQDCDTTYLQTKAIKYGFSIDAKNKFDPNWYLCSTNKNSTGDALELIDILLTENRIIDAEADFIYQFKLDCVNDTGFQAQWNLKNTNQYNPNFNLDINICPAWDTTKGDSSIIVAVFDAGISKTHPDMTNLHPFSYNCISGLPTPPNSDTFPYSTLPDNKQSHGTAVASVIGANHNSFGYAGVAPKCKIMDIAYDFKSNRQLLQSLRIAAGFDTAWRKGVSVINCSWGVNPGIVWIPTTTEGLPSPSIDAAISRAATLGRNGKGCILVFSTGNFSGLGNYNYVHYPANSNTNNILAVGAIDIDGKLSENFAFGLVSHYGKEMDIVVHGTNIPILGYDPSTQANFYATSLGTSFAAPQVAGVAALILSKNPTLSARQVMDILENNVTKLPAYSSNYATVAGRTNGTWYEKSGYGLLNAHQSIKNTPNLTPSICTIINIENQILINNSTFCNIINSKNSTVQSGINIFDHKESTNLNEGFEIKEGASFEVKYH